MSQIEVVEMSELVKAKTVIWESVLALLVVLCTILGGTYLLVIPDIKEDVHTLQGIQSEDRVAIRALEISDARTGVHLVQLAEAIDRLIVKLDK